MLYTTGHTQKSTFGAKVAEYVAPEAKLVEFLATINEESVWFSRLLAQKDTWADTLLYNFVGFFVCLFF